MQRTAAAEAAATTTKTAEAVGGRLLGCFPESIAYFAGQNEGRVKSIAHFAGQKGRQASGGVRAVTEGGEEASHIA